MVKLSRNPGLKGLVKIARMQFVCLKQRWNPSPTEDSHPENPTSRRVGETPTYATSSVAISTVVKPLILLVIWIIHGEYMVYMWFIYGQIIKSLTTNGHSHPIESLQPISLIIASVDVKSSITDSRQNLPPVEG